MNNGTRPIIDRVSDRTLYKLRYALPEALPELIVWLDVQVRIYDSMLSNAVLSHLCRTSGMHDCLIRAMDPENPPRMAQRDVATYFEAVSPALELRSSSLPTILMFRENETLLVVLAVSLHNSHAILQRTC